MINPYRYEVAEGSFSPADYSPTFWFAPRRETTFADNDSMATATDWSAGGHNLTTNLSINRPTYKAAFQNGNAVAYFDGNDVMSTAASLSKDTLLGADVGTTTYFVAKQVSAGGAHGAWSWNSGNVPRFACYLSYSNSTYYDDPDYNSGRCSVSVSSGDQTSWHIWTYYRSGNTRQIDRDSTNILNTTVVGGPHSSSLSALSIGDYNGIRLTGYIAEMLIFPVAHTSDEKAAVRGYLKSIWNTP